MLGVIAVEELVEVCLVKGAAWTRSICNGDDVVGPTLTDFSLERLSMVAMVVIMSRGPAVFVVVGAVVRGSLQPIILGLPLLVLSVCFFGIFHVDMFVHDRHYLSDRL